jgi:hypothetical protein
VSSRVRAIASVTWKQTATNADTVSVRNSERGSCLPDSQSRKDTLTFILTSQVVSFDVLNIHNTNSVLVIMGHLLEFYLNYNREKHSKLTSPPSGILNPVDSTVSCVA